MDGPCENGRKSIDEAGGVAILAADRANFGGGKRCEESDGGGRAAVQMAKYLVGE